jgi:mono/diheme cytochrome c family protein
LFQWYLFEIIFIVCRLTLLFSGFSTAHKQLSLLVTMEKTMKNQKPLKGMLLVAGLVFAGASIAAEPSAEIGEKIYTRAFGRGCGTCHDVQPNPNLFESANKLNKEEFTKVLADGRNAMPKAMDQIMALPQVKSAGLTQEQAVDSLIAYLKAGKK